MFRFIAMTLYLHEDPITYIIYHLVVYSSMLLFFLTKVIYNFKLHFWLRLNRWTTNIKRILEDNLYIYLYVGNSPKVHVEKWCTVTVLQKSMRYTLNLESRNTGLPNWNTVPFTTNLSLMVWGLIFQKGQPKSWDLLHKHLHNRSLELM